MPTEIYIDLDEEVEAVQYNHYKMFTFRHQGRMAGGATYRDIINLYHQIPIEEREELENAQVHRVRD